MSTLLGAIKSRLWDIVKDGLKALLFWVVARVLLVYFWGYPGYMLSLLLGIILLISFIGLSLAKLVYLFTRPGIPGSGREPLPPNPMHGQGSTAKCSVCHGTGRARCTVCFGQRGKYVYPQTASGTSQWVPCPACLGNGDIQCTGPGPH